MIAHINYFQHYLHTVFAQYMRQESPFPSSQDIPLPESQWLSKLTDRKSLNKEERIVLLLTLIPHLNPHILDVFFIENPTLDRPYTEFGGWKGAVHGGFMPTAETAVFLLSEGNPEEREIFLPLFNPSHWFYTENILYLEGPENGEPFLSSRLLLTDYFQNKLFNNPTPHPAYSSGFPAKQISTSLEWDELILPYDLAESINDISIWLNHEKEICERWQLNRFVKKGYRCLFYGPPGTGKTLTASLLGKQHQMPVFRIDLSMVISKYIGETEKNLAGVFDKAEHQKWILFFDEADALFGKRTQTNSSNDRHANQEVAYLLQRIEDFPGMIILATNLKENLDEAFLRRFQSVLYFPIPDKQLRLKLWEQMIPEEWLNGDGDKLLQMAAEYECSGGSIVNVIQNCSIKLFGMNKSLLDKNILHESIIREQIKEGKNLKNIRV
ncbi:ATP-binding protein [Bacteroidales bacterium OttesenSCG-928-A17]|nr:ATP-binding protein [Bacteroidales bacterium OttesenSCG-928-A17]